MLRLVICSSFLLFLSLCLADNVPEYTDETFNDEIEKHETSLVLFYAPWCGHCTKLKPKFAEAAKILMNDDPPVNLAKVDCSEHGESVCGHYTISGYPTMYVFKNGEVKNKYDGDRSAKEIIKYMRSIAGPIVKPMIDGTDIEAVLKNTSMVVVVGSFISNGKLFDAYQKVANKFSDRIVFYQSTVESDKTSEFQEQMILYQPPHLRSMFEEHTFIYQPEKMAEASEETLEDFIMTAYHGLVGHRTSSNKNEFKKPTVTVYYDVDFDNNLKTSRYWRNRVLSVAKKYQGEDITFSFSHLPDFKSDFGEITYGNPPVVLGVDAEDRKYFMEEVFSVENFENFVKGFVNNSLEPYVKSEPIPKENNGLIKKCVGRTANEMLLYNQKDVVVLFYSPSCDECDEFLGYIEKAADILKDENVEFIQMDSTKNFYTDEFTVKEYPTVYWIPTDHLEEKEKYDTKEKDVDKLVAFIAKKATRELKGYTRKGKPRKNKKNEL